jgi:hypothetical protein
MKPRTLTMANRKKETKPHQFGVKLTDDQRERVVAYAERRRVTNGQAIRELVEIGLEHAGGR